MGPRTWFALPSPTVAASLLLISSSTVLFYTLESCVDSTCPVRPAGSAPAPVTVVPQVLLSPTYRETALSRLADPAVAAPLFACILRSEVASLALVVAAWVVAVTLLFAFLGVVIGPPRGAELAALLRTASIFAISCALSSVHILAVSTSGYTDATAILLFWAVKFAACAASTLLPLRSESLRRAARVRLRPLAAIAAAAAALAAAHARATLLVLASAATLPPVVLFECTSVALHALQFGHLAAADTLHIADELANRAAAASPDPDAVPSVWNERRAELRDRLKFVHDLLESAALFAHHGAVLRCFGFGFRLGDALLMYDMRHFSVRVLVGVQEALRRSLAHTVILQAFAVPSDGARTRPFFFTPICRVWCRCAVRCCDRHRCVLPGAVSRLATLGLDQRHATVAPCLVLPRCSPARLICTQVQQLFPPPSGPARSCNDRIRSQHTDAHCIRGIRTRVQPSERPHDDCRRRGGDRKLLHLPRRAAARERRRPVAGAADALRPRIPRVVPPAVGHAQPRQARDVPDVPREPRRRALRGVGGRLAAAGAHGARLLARLAPAALCLGAQSPLISTTGSPGLCSTWLACALPPGTPPPPVFGRCVSALPMH